MLEINKPTLIVNKDIIRANILRMYEKSQIHNLTLRPHFKTHQSRFIGKIFRDIGINSITVSTASLAEYFVEDGWANITIAFPVNILELDRINKINKSCTLNLLVDNIEVVQLLSEGIEAEIGLFIKIDAGYNRAGVKNDNYDYLDLLLKEIDKYDKIVFKGFLLHSGHTYGANSKEEICKIHQIAVSVLNELKVKYVKQYPNLIISLGDTPATSICDDFSGIDEIRPGNFVFYDVMQYELGSCGINDIAITLAAPVISKYNDRKEIMIYAGGTHLSKEFLTIKDMKVYGYLVKFKKDKWEVLPKNNFIKSLSQVHGLLELEDEVFNEINIGDIIGVLPIHSCMTVNEMKSMITTEGDIIDVMPPFQL